jgi:hypothetical protein
METKPKPLVTDIILPALGNPITCVPAGAKISWTNDTGADVISFTMPHCVSDKKVPALPMAHRESTGPYEIDDEANGHYHYYWEPGTAIGDPRSGTIQVGSGM